MVTKLCIQRLHNAYTFTTIDGRHKLPRQHSPLNSLRAMLGPAEAYFLQGLCIYVAVLACSHVAPTS